jgi:hypothetical protein
MSVRPNVVLAVVAGLVVALGIVAAVVSGSREPQRLDPATPEGTVQLFLTALFDGDEEAAADHLAPDLGCEPPFDAYLPDGARLEVVSSTTEGGEAEVVVDVVERSGGLLADEWSHRASYELVADDEGWLISGQAWPVYSCEKGW